jgi:hypothetical protein
MLAGELPGSGHRRPFILRAESDAAGLELRDGEIDTGANRGEAREGPWCIEQDLGEFGGSLAIVDPHPFRDHGSLIGSCPFEEAQDDGPMRARLNGLHELGICHGCSIASALKLEFLIVDIK